MWQAPAESFAYVEFHVDHLAYDVTSASLVPVRQVARE
jgi:hypothetical protein